MRAWTVIVFTLLWTVSCNQVNLTPIDPAEEPTEEAKVVKTRFPAAKDIVFKPIMPGNIWEVDFSSGTDEYTSLVDKTKMWETFRANKDSVPVLLTDLLSGTIFDGGTFADNAEDIDYFTSGERRNRLVYRLNGADYSFDWRRYNGVNYRPTNATFEQIKYHIHLPKLGDLPEPIKTFLVSKPSLELQYGEVRVKLNNEKQFYVQVIISKADKNEVGFMLFDEKGDLKWMSRDFNLPANPPSKSNIDTLPEPIQKHLDQSPELSGLKYLNEPFDKWKGEFAGVSSYTLKLTSSDNSRACEMMFDQDGNLLNKRYFISF